MAGSNLSSWLLRRAEPTSLLPQLKTATDVLRVAAVRSGGDVSLASPTRFRKFSRRERRFFLRALKACDSITEDILRNDRPFATDNAKVEASLTVNDTSSTIELLRQRSGIFSRRLDHLLGLGGGREAVDAFLPVADRVATPVLLQAFHHFQTRAEGRSPRGFFPKGNAARVQVQDGALAPLPEDLTGQVARGLRDVLVRRFARLAPLGKVRVDEAPGSYLVPFAMRSASKPLRTIARGSRVEQPEANII